MKIDEVITIVLYNEHWPTLFEAEKAIISNAFGEMAIEIEHFGSTSVPGMCAKPIIDILVGVVSLELDNSTIFSLEQLSYEGFGEAGVPGRLYFRKRKEQAYNLAVVLFGGEQWNNNILIRNYLRTTPGEAAQYSSLKQSSIDKGITTLIAYSNDKADYMQNLLERAKKYNSA